LTIQEKTAVFTEKFVETVVFFYENFDGTLGCKKIVRAIDMCLQANGDCRGHSENGSGYIFIDLYID